MKVKICEIYRKTFKGGQREKRVKYWRNRRVERLPVSFLLDIRYEVVHNRISPSAHFHTGASTSDLEKIFPEATNFLCD